MTETFLSGRVTMLLGDVRERLRDLPTDHFDCVVTSPPYWGLRDYGVSGQIGMEPTLAEHIAVMVDVFREVRRVLKPTGVCWINYGDCYATAPNGRSAADTKKAHRKIVCPECKGNPPNERGPTGWHCETCHAHGFILAEPDDRTFRDKPFSTVGPIQMRSNGNEGQHLDRRGGYLKAKDLCMVPERLFIALQDDGWWVRSKLPWIKRNGMPESITDRPANSLEQVALLTKSERYWYDADAVRKAASASTNARVAQNTAAQAGSLRANGGARTNGPMKAVVRKPGITPKSAGEDTNIKAKGSFHASTTEVLNDRNFRNTDLFFSSLEAPWGLISDADGTPLAIDANPQGFSEAHFATFPPALIKPLIKAGSSQAGNCPHCGSSWSRETEKTAMVIRKTARNEQRGTRSPARSVTIGWIPTCDCPDHDPEPSRVLDPFGGAGTTAMVSVALGRNATLIELNPEYAVLARARIEAHFMGLEEGARHMVKQTGKLLLDAGPLFATTGSG